MAWVVLVLTMSMSEEGVIFDSSIWGASHGGRGCLAALSEVNECAAASIHAEHIQILSRWKVRPVPVSLSIFFRMNSVLMCFVLAVEFTKLRTATFAPAEVDPSIAKLDSGKSGAFATSLATLSFTADWPWAVHLMRPLLWVLAVFSESAMGRGKSHLKGFVGKNILWT